MSSWGRKLQKSQDQKAQLEQDQRLSPVFTGTTPNQAYQDIIKAQEALMKTFPIPGTPEYTGAKTHLGTIVFALIDLACLLAHHCNVDFDELWHLLDHRYNFHSRKISYAQKMALLENQMRELMKKRDAQNP
jgi:hypothetical protein